MHGLISVYFNTISQNFSRYLEIVQEFYNENTYLYLGFFVNYTFLHFLYYLYLYYRNNFPKEIENKLTYFRNLSDQLSSRNLYLEKMLNELNILSQNVSSENTKFLEIIKKQESENQLLLKEKDDSLFLIDELREKLFITKRNVKELKSVVENLDILLKNGDDHGASLYISDFLTVNKKRKLG